MHSKNDFSYYITMLSLFTEHGWEWEDMEQEVLHSYTSIFQPRNSKSVFAVCSWHYSQSNFWKSNGFWERMLFGVGVVWNILKSAKFPFHLLFLIGTLVSPWSERMQFLIDTQVFYSPLDPWHSSLTNDLICACFFFQTYFFFWHTLPPWSDSCLLLWLCFPPISCHSKLQSSYDEGFVIFQPLLPIQASCPMLSTCPYMWNSLHNLVSCFSLPLKNWSIIISLGSYLLWFTSQSAFVSNLFSHIMLCLSLFVYRSFHSILTFIFLLDRKISRTVTLFIYVFPTQVSSVAPEI